MSSVMGQDSACRILETALSAGRMHHAWIFHGPFGVGKATVARALARSLLTASRKLESSPGWDHPDLHIITKEMASDSSFARLRERKQMNIPIDLLRERMIGGWIGSGDNRTYVDAAIARTPSGKHGKVFMIDEAELLAREGQNALLKTLEEPPPQTTIILVTRHEHRLLPTLRSRCQRVGFSVLSDAQIRQWLDRRLPEKQKAIQSQIDEITRRSEGSKRKKPDTGPLQESLNQLDLNDEQKHRITRLADGSPGRADLAIDFRLDLWVETLSPLIRQIRSGRFPAEFGTQTHDCIQAMAESWVERHPAASKDAANKQALLLMLGILSQFCRSAIRAEIEKLSGHDRAALRESLEPWLDGIERIQDAQFEMDGNVPIPLLLDNLAVQWAEQVRRC